jgi:hypothetical protein
MRTKLIIAATAFVFLLVGWNFFNTPSPTVPGLERPKIDRLVFAGESAKNPAAARAEQRRKERQERLNKKKAQNNSPNAGEEKSGFLKSFFNDSGDGVDGKTNQPVLGNTFKSSPAKPKTSIRSRSKVKKNKNEFLTKRREARRKRMEARKASRKEKSLSNSKAKTVVEKIEEPPLEDYEIEVEHPGDIPEYVGEDSEVQDAEAGVPEDGQGEVVE